MFSSSISRLALLTVLGTVMAAAVSAPGALAAAQRYASPGGTGTSCSAASPCSIAQAVGNSNTGDEVIVNPGDYPLTSTLSDGSTQMTIHGVAGQSRPRLLFSGAAQAGVRLEYGSTLRYVEIDQTSGNATALYAAQGAKVDQVIARAPGNPNPAGNIQNSSIRNSMVVASGTNGLALLTDSSSASTSNYRNVTAIATGSGGVAIGAFASTATGNVTVNLVNVIAHGGPGGPSLKALTDDSGAGATITATHTNYQSGDSVGVAAALVDGGGNRAEEPAFVDAAAGDYRQAAGSYTIDAGVNGPINGVFDVDGDLRTIGTTDIGADEFVVAAPAPTPDPATTTTPANPPARPFAGVKLVSTRLTLAGRFITVKLSCPGTAGRCSGSTKLTAKRRRTSSRAATVTLGRASFSIAAGQRAKVKVRVSRAGRRLFARTRRLPGRAANAAHNGTGQSKTTVAAVTIRRRIR